MLKLHTYDIIKTATLQVKELSQERGFPLHAGLYASWGVGKTIACKQIIKEAYDVFYFKFPPRHLEPAGAIKELLTSMGVGATRGYLNNYDFLIKFLQARGITKPVLIIDEAQLLFTQPKLLSFFKDLSEDIEINFSYVFLGDEKLKDLLKRDFHSIIKRIKIKLEIPQITKETIQKLADFHQITLPEEAFNIALSMNATTMDIDFALYLAKKANLTELDEKKFKAFIKKSKTGV